MCPVFFCTAEACIVSLTLIGPDLGQGWGEISIVIGSRLDDIAVLGEF